jgi:hypothetical protein
VLVAELALKSRRTRSFNNKYPKNHISSCSPEVEQIMRDEIEAGRADKSLETSMIDDQKNYKD